MEMHDHMLLYKLKCPTCRSACVVSYDKNKVFGQDNDCIICMQNKINIYLPCGHINICFECVKKISSEIINETQLVQMQPSSNMRSLNSIINTCTTIQPQIRQNDVIRYVHPTILDVRSDGILYRFEPLNIPTDRITDVVRRELEIYNRDYGMYMQKSHELYDHTDKKLVDEKHKYLYNLALSLFRRRLSILSKINDNCNNSHKRLYDYDNCAHCNTKCRDRYYDCSIYCMRAWFCCWCCDESCYYLDELPPHGLLD